MKRVKTFVSLVVVIIVAAGASGLTSAAQKKRAASRAERGRAVYEARCARCHGSDGAGRTRMAEVVLPPDMSDAEWQRSRSAARMIASVTDGLGQMPAFRKRLTRQEIAAVVAYVRTLGR